MTGDERSTAAPRAPSRLRRALGVAGLTVLMAAGLGVYFSMTGTERTDRGKLTANQFALRLHPAPRTLPALAFVEGAGRELSLTGFRGKVVLLNVWATWCPPCRQEMPALDRLQQALGGPPVSGDRTVNRPRRAGRGPELLRGGRHPRA